MQEAAVQYKIKRIVCLGYVQDDLRCSGARASQVKRPRSSVLRPPSSVLHLSRCTNKTFEICKLARALVLVVVEVVDDARGLGVVD